MSGLHDEGLMAAAAVTSGGLQQLPQLSSEPDPPRTRRVVLVA